MCCFETLLGMSLAPVVAAAPRFGLQGLVSVPSREEGGWHGSVCGPCCLLERGERSGGVPPGLTLPFQLGECVAGMLSTSGSGRNAIFCSTAVAYECRQSMSEAVQIEHEGSAPEGVAWRKGSGGRKWTWKECKALVVTLSLRDQPPQLRQDLAAAQHTGGEEVSQVPESWGTSVGGAVGKTGVRAALAGRWGWGQPAPAAPALAACVQKSHPASRAWPQGGQWWSGGAQVLTRAGLGGLPGAVLPELPKC